MNEIRVLCPRGRKLDYPEQHELQPFVPDGATQLNYGQGEGQIRIGDSVWGVYLSDSKAHEYHIQFEEGDLTPSEFMKGLESIRSALERYFEFPVEIRLSGILGLFVP